MYYNNLTQDRNWIFSGRLYKRTTKKEFQSKQNVSGAIISY